MRGDLAFIDKCMLESNGQGEGEEKEDLSQPQRRPLDHERTQGIVNNLRGFEGELLAAHTAPGVVGLNKKFWDASRTISVEVDVVAQEGVCWIEVKSHEIFGLQSIHWAGSSSGVKGLSRQVEELLAASRSEHNQRRWSPPRVVIFFPSGADPGVRARLEESGVHVASGPGRYRVVLSHHVTSSFFALVSVLVLLFVLSWDDVRGDSSRLSHSPILTLVLPDSLLSLPPPPGLPAVTNLDVTTLCALCSEVGGCLKCEVMFAERRPCDDSEHPVWSPPHVDQYVYC